MGGGGVEGARAPVEVCQGPTPEGDATPTPTVERHVVADADAAPAAEHHLRSPLQIDLGDVTAEGDHIGERDF